MNYKMKIKTRLSLSGELPTPWMKVDTAAKVAEGLIHEGYEFDIYRDTGTAAERISLDELRNDYRLFRSGL